MTNTAIIYEDYCYKGSTHVCIIFCLSRDYWIHPKIKRSEVDDERIESQDISIYEVASTHMQDGQRYTSRVMLSCEDRVRGKKRLICKLQFVALATYQAVKNKWLSCHHVCQPSKWYNARDPISYDGQLKSSLLLHYISEHAVPWSSEKIFCRTRLSLACFVMIRKHLPLVRKNSRTRYVRNDLHSFDLVGSSNRTHLALHVMDERTMEQIVWSNLCCRAHLIFPKKLPIKL